MLTFESIIDKLQLFWKKEGCIILQPIDQEVGAGTFHHGTFFYTIKKKKWKTAYIQPTKRPQDSRLYNNPIKRSFFHQYQIILKPPLEKTQLKYLQSLEYIGINIKNNDIQFIEDNWKSPTLAAYGIGWEVRVNGLEISQITYFQKIGGITCKPTAVEITYGLERIAIIIQKKKNIDNIIWNIKYQLTYKDLFNDYTKELDIYNLQHKKIKNLLYTINIFFRKGKSYLKKNLIFLTYDTILKLSNIFNLLDASYILTPKKKKNIVMKIQTLSKKVANKYMLINKKKENV